MADAEPLRRISEASNTVFKLRRAPTDQVTLCIGARLAGAYSTGTSTFRCKYSRASGDAKQQTKAGIEMENERTLHFSFSVAAIG